ncbi:MAG: GNAT family N-acetyltransferase [Bacillota bacterium]
MSEPRPLPDVLKQIRRGNDRDWPAIVDIAFAPEAMSAQLSPYRNWTTDHLLAIKRQIVDAWQDRLREALAHAVFVAEGQPDGRVVGYVMVTVSDTPAGRQGWVMEIGVDKALWGQGLGTILLAKAEDYCRDNGARYIGLGVSSFNERALRLYDHMGYKEERRHLVKVL